MDQIERIFQKLDKIEEVQKEQHSVLVKQEANLDKHIRRTEINELAIENLQEIDKKQHELLLQVQGGTKVLTILMTIFGSVFGAIATLASIYHYLLK